MSPVGEDDDDARTDGQVRRRDPGRGERTRGRSTQTLNGSYGLTPPDLEGLLEPDAGRLARPVPRGARRRKAPGLPDRCRSRLEVRADFSPSTRSLAGARKHRRSRTGAHSGEAAIRDVIPTLAATSSTAVWRASHILALLRRAQSPTRSERIVRARFGPTSASLEGSAPGTAPNTPSATFTAGEAVVLGFCEPWLRGRTSDVMRPPVPRS